MSFWSNTVKPLNFAWDLISRISRGHWIREILSPRNRPINSANHGWMPMVLAKQNFFNMYNSHFNSCDCLALILSLKLVFASQTCCLFVICLLLVWWLLHTHTHTHGAAMFVCGSHLIPSFRSGQASVLARLTKRFWFPAKGSLGHNLVTLVKFQDPQNVLATYEQENCATVSSTPFCDLSIKWANE